MRHPPLFHFTRQLVGDDPLSVVLYPNFESALRSDPRLIAGTCTSMDSNGTVEPSSEEARHGLLGGRL